MPYKIVTSEGKHCVHKKKPDGSVGKRLKCHTTRAQATAHMRALHANVSDTSKEGTMPEITENVEDAETLEKAKNDIVEKGFVPYDILSFAELDVYREAQEHTEEVLSDLDDYAGLVHSVASNQDVQDKAMAFKKLAAEFWIRNRDPEKEAVEEAEKEVTVKLDAGDVLGQLKALVDKVKSLVTKDEKPEENKEQEKSTGFLVYKDEEGTMRWFARYSNNFRDDDSPPEIISAKSHSRFEKIVDEGKAKYPVLQVWHEPALEFGKATWVAWDDSGFALAAGTIDKGCEYIAEYLSKQEDIAMSHGMPNASIKRDADDNSIIVEHETVEISVLPRKSAANKLTDFVILDQSTKEDSMSVSLEKLEALKNAWGLPTEELEKLEARNKADAEKATEERESKEISEETESKDVKDEAAEKEKAGEPETKEETEAPAQEDANTEPSPYPDREEIAETFVPIIRALSEQVEALVGRLDQVDEEIKAVKESDEEKIKTLVNYSTPATLSALMAQNLRAVGSEDALVDGRKSLAKSKPKETAAAPQGVGRVPFIQRMLEEGGGFELSN